MPPDYLDFIQSDQGKDLWQTRWSKAGKVKLPDVHGQGGRFIIAVQGRLHGFKCANNLLLPLLDAAIRQLGRANEARH